ncbi:MarR family transcriptional regulator [uncultured Catenibacterium sp.]|uniref:MarR family transcriptional regulator n=1 Tax=uncultured Catenibacterium sp. TaxID=286142 RepID=UPI0025EEC01E|nr:MarR family transcriptional regulator [uncultured Catenibacterium sp.]
MIDHIFGLSIKYEPWDNKSILPLYIVNSYQFYAAYIENIRCIVIKPIEELPTLPSLKKQIQKIRVIDDVPIVLYSKTISFYRRKSLLENHIPFMTDKQVFLPFIGTLLVDEKGIEKTKDKFVYSTQLLFLAYMYNHEKKVYVSDLSKNLPFSAMTLSRAVKQLEMTDLFLVYKDGVNKVIESKYSYKELFERIQHHLLTPVRQVGYMDQSLITNYMVLAGEIALSEMTMLNPSRLRTYAVYEKDFDKTQLIDELIDPDVQVKVEIWAYDPHLFTHTNIADTLSIVLSLKENKDERIEEVLEDILEKELTD